MISLKQVQLLEMKVEQAVRKITELQAENTQLKSVSAELKGQNDQLVRKVADLEESLAAYEQDKDRIEEGIAGALQRLNNIESSVLKPASVSDEVAESAAVRAISQAFSEQNAVAEENFNGASPVAADDVSAVDSLYLSDEDDMPSDDGSGISDGSGQLDIY